MARHPTRAATLGLDAIQIEGGLIAPEQVAKIAATDRNARTAADYDCPKGTNLGDEISRYFRIGQAHWQAYCRIEQPTATQTAKFAHDLLTEAFGFADLVGPTDRHQGTRRYRLAWEAKDGRVPIVVAAPVPTPGDGFAKAMPEFGDGSEGRAKRSPVVLLQDWLNGSDAALWGLVFAGDRVRLMRDNASLTRPAWIEADLSAMFRDEMFADFTAWWLLTHASRFGAAGTPPSSSPLEQWREAGLSQGTAARERLREGVETAIAELGQGLIEANADLRDGVATGRIAMPALFEELLRTVYRLIFLAVAEDRDLLHGRAVPQGPRALYRDGYSFGFWRDRSARRAAYDGHHDAWAGMLVTLGALEHGEALLGLPPLGGLFAKGSTPILNSARIPNRRFLSAIYSLGFITVESRQTRINWRDMKTEELGSVYESLLEIRPVLMPNGDFVLEGGAKGNARKTSGSYYTPDSLVETLLDSALDPVLERAEAEGEAAILNLKVIDPACGSGHFLLGAARRMAGRLARLRNPDAGRDDEQAALRDVVSRCIHGVDRNPMAVELAKVALWIESVSPGQPLGFLDANIRCGDALLGIFSLDALAEGIPDDAYKPLTGDDKATANGLKKLNKAERDSGLLRLVTQPDKLASAFQRFHAMPENTPREVAARASEYERIRLSPGWVALRQACDAYVAAFILPKPALPSPQAKPLIPTTRHLRDILSGGTMLGTGAVQGPLAAAIDGAAWRARAFHWPIEFPDVMVGRGGFDVVLGNPPWDTMSPDYKEYFATFNPDIRHMSPAEQELAYADMLADPSVAENWNQHCAALYAAVHFIKSSGRYRLFADGNLGKGDFNVYRMFVETALAATRKGCVAAQFVPEGLCNGANATAIRKELFSVFRLDRLGGFENTKGIWFSKVHTAMKFCIYVAWKGGRTDTFDAAFRINTPEKLQAFKTAGGLKIPVAIVTEFSPDALAVMEFAAQSEVDICARMYALYPKFGAEIDGLPYRHYMREIDMGTDRGLFSEGADGLPVFEGRMIDAYDYRAKGYVSGRGRSAVWEDFPFSSPQKGIQQQWRVLQAKVPNKLRARSDRFRIGFGDVASPTNQRGLVAALLPNCTVSGHKVPTIEFINGGPRDILLWLGVANSLVMDFLVRKKISLTMSYTIMDSLPFPRDFEMTRSSAEIARRVCSLCAVGPEMETFQQEAIAMGILAAGEFIVDPDQRAVVAAEIDVLVARDVFQMRKEEMLYILDPDNILGQDCGVETFKALRNAEQRVFDEFRTQKLILDAWERV